MNPQNQQSASMEVILKGPYTISEQQFRTWHTAWSREVVDAETLSQYFVKGDEYLASVQFDDYTIQNLISSVGVKNIQARFIIMDKYKPYEIESPTFSIVLYATDTQGKLCSAYHLGFPVYKNLDQVVAHRLNNYRGSISDNLATKWINNWTDVVKNLPFKNVLFSTNYGLLDGYNYIMADFMYALYPPNTNLTNYEITINLAAHKHIPHYWVESGTQFDVFTFGLVVTGTENQHHDHNKLQGGGANTYYDLSLPCPPNQ